MASSGEESPDAYIPGVSEPGNRRPTRSSVRVRKTKEIKAHIPVKQPLVENLKTDSLSSQSTSMASIDSVNEQSCLQRSIQQLKKQASLKDLRPEDKLRIANLIKELARVGEQREQAVTQLHGEREQHEEQLMTLVQQQEKILLEREEIQSRLFQCQELLTAYQGQILNKQDKLNSSIADIKQVKPTDSAGAIKTDPTNQRPAWRSSNPMTAVDHVIEIETISAKDRVKRPFTALIDKEIARERSLSRSSHGSIGSRSRSVSPHDGRPKFYPDHIPGIGPLHEPIASSTHKSMDIRAQISSNTVDLDSPRSSLRGSSIRGTSPVTSDRQGRGRVAFIEHPDRDEDHELHSPNLNLNKNKMFKDPHFADYYKKLTSSGRKRELLTQRKSLLDEQERLRKVLEQQEEQLRTRQDEYNQRQQLQKDRMEFYSKGDKFPPLKLDFDGESVVESVGEIGEKVKGDREEDRRGLTVGYTREQDRREQIERRLDAVTPPIDTATDDPVQFHSRVSASTSPMTLRDKVSMATSPIQSPWQPEDIADEDIPRLVDVATSISYRSPLRDASNRQGNLPLQMNRQRGSPVIKPQTASPPSTARSRIPGDKTLNVLEIVNSMDKVTGLGSLNGSFSDRENKPEPVQKPNKLKSSLKTGNQGSDYRHYTSPKPGAGQGRLLKEEEESAEESQILEDIFFLS